MITEREFDHFFQSVGYSRVTEDLGPAPEFENADYINKSDKIIVELKVIEKEHFPEGGVIDSLGTLVFKPQNIDPVTGNGMYSIAIPGPNREGRPDQFEEPIRRLLKKANRQIRATKEYFKSADANYFGIVCFALVGMTSISPLMVGHLVRHLLEHEFKSIDAFIITRPYELLRDPISLEMHAPAVSYSINRDSRLVPICYELAARWTTFRDQGGHPIPS